MADPVARLADDLSEVAGIPVTLERPNDAEHGDYATNVALKLAGVRRRPPRDIATELAYDVLARGLAERAEPAGPGFVNLWLSDEWLARAVAEIVEGDAGFGGGSAVAPERIQVEIPIHDHFFEDRAG